MQGTPTYMQDAMRMHNADARVIDRAEMQHAGYGQRWLSYLCPDLDRRWGCVQDVGGYLMPVISSGGANGGVRSPTAPAGH